MSHSDHVRKLKPLVENNDEFNPIKLIAEITELAKLIKETKRSWYILVMNAWQEFIEDPSTPPTQEEFIVIKRSLETRLARQLRSLEHALEEIQVKISELEQSMPQFPMYGRFLYGLDKSVKDIKRSIEILEDQGYYDQTDRRTRHPWSFHNEINSIYENLLRIQERCLNLNKFIDRGVAVR